MVLKGILGGDVLKHHKDYLEDKSKVLAHIGGASGSGKTTLANKLQTLHPDISFKDLDEFDDEAVDKLGWNKIRKNDYDDEMLGKLASLRQELMDKYIKDKDNKIVLLGHHTEGDHVLNIPTKNRFLLDVDARTSAMRAYNRSQKEKSEHRRTIEELPGDIKEAEKDIEFLKNSGYKPMSHESVEEWIRSNK